MYPVSELQEALEALVFVGCHLLAHEGKLTVQEP
jgi:hypothetical protein